MTDFVGMHSREHAQALFFEHLFLPHDVIQVFALLNPQFFESRHPQALCIVLLGNVANVVGNPIFGHAFES